MNKLSVSVIIPCYKSSNTIERALESVVCQTCLPKEIILIDDCSNDNGKTIFILDKLKTKYEMIVDIKIIFLEENQGAGSARNRGLECASQKYIAFLDSDDVWHPKKLEIQYNFMEENQELLLTTHYYKQIKNLSELNEYFQFGYSVLNPKILLFKNVISTRSVMMRNIIQYRFKEGKRYSEDYLLWMQVAFSGGIAIINLELAGIFKADYGDSGLSAQLWNMEKGEMENYYELYKKGEINIGYFILCTSFSLLKFLFRLIKIGSMRITIYNAKKNLN